MYIRFLVNFTILSFAYTTVQVYVNPISPMNNTHSKHFDTFVATVPFEGYCTIGTLARAGLQPNQPHPNLYSLYLIRPIQKSEAH